MLLVLQHSTYCVIHDLVARAMFFSFWRLRFYYYLFLKFLLPLVQGENLAWSTAIVPVFC